MLQSENTGLRTELDSVKEDLCNTRQALSSITRQLACEGGRSNTELQAQVQRLVAGDQETRETLQGLRKRVEEVKRDMVQPVKSSRGQDLYRRTGKRWLVERSNIIALCQVEGSLFLRNLDSETEFLQVL